MSSSPNSDEERKLDFNPLLLAGSGNRKSAFLPYKPTTTVLTNLQRGNTEANIPSEICLNFHEKTGQGEITEEQVRAEKTVDSVDSNNYTPLHWACYYGQLSSVQILINCGANPNREAIDMVSPLLLAAAGGHHEIVRLLIQKGAKVNHMNVEGNTALMYAAAGNHPHTCNELLTRGANLTETNEDGETAYSLAVKNQSNLAQAVLENYITSLLMS
ncbi:DNA-binding protein rfxank [Culex quinquefasciatus]|uniref:DNA-binding protein rfxank n=1 Tax=Culex quinquefasciatus TaxID=7176 RepID=B0W1C3_CULQU|nr:DNA-binding protein RFXANK [Culex quinquefasciatus]EDS44993.1 DNA-binding protein rfxank [Culex quinquefasciatus]|eukprot:XP_001842507.1 DNA-binding protein rfxank [Culex quinquefasciatus]